MFSLTSPETPQKDQPSHSDITKRPSVFVRLRNVPVEFHRPSEQFQTHILHSKLAPSNVKSRVDTGNPSHQNNQQQSISTTSSGIESEGCVSILTNGKRVIVHAPAKCNYAHLPSQEHWFDFDGCFSALSVSDAQLMMPILRNQHYDRIAAQVAKQATPASSFAPAAFLLGNNNNNTNKSGKDVSPSKHLLHQQQKSTHQEKIAAALANTKETPLPLLPDTPEPIQDEVLFDRVARPAIEAVIQLRVPGCLFGFGMTSSGKTRTLFGSESQSIASIAAQKSSSTNATSATSATTTTTAHHKKDPIAPTSVYNASLAIARDPANHQANAGLVQLACNRLLEVYPLGICISFYEVYNEKLRCLFSGGEVTPVLTSEGMNFRGLSRVIVKSNEELRKKILEGMKMRKVASTHRNDHSSRSHAVLQMFPILEMRPASNVQNNNNNNNNNNSFSESKLLPMISERLRFTVVDLAGSERLNAASPAQQRESAQINLALSNLGRVIQSLSQLRNTSNITTTSVAPTSSSAVNKLPEKNVDPECRASALTWALRDELQFKTAVSFLITISPMTVHANETLSSLRFAAMLANIRTVIRIGGPNHSSHDLKVASENIAKELDFKRQATFAHANTACNIVCSPSRSRRRNQQQRMMALPVSNDEEFRSPHRILNNTVQLDSTQISKSDQEENEENKMNNNNNNNNKAASPGPRNPKNVVFSKNNNNNNTTPKTLAAARLEKQKKLLQDQQQEKTTKTLSRTNTNGSASSLVRSNSTSQPQQQQANNKFNNSKNTTSLLVDGSTQYSPQNIRQQDESVMGIEDERQNQNVHHRDHDGDEEEAEEEMFLPTTAEREDAFERQEEENFDSLLVRPIDSRRSNSQLLHAPEFEPSPARSNRTTQSTIPDLDKIEELVAEEAENHNEIEFSSRSPKKTSSVASSSATSNNNNGNLNATTASDSSSHLPTTAMDTTIAIITSVNVDFDNLDYIVIDQEDEKLHFSPQVALNEDEDGIIKNKSKIGRRHRRRQQDHSQLKLYSATTPILSLGECDFFVVGKLFPVQQWWKHFKNESPIYNKNLIISCVVLADDNEQDDQDHEKQENGNNNNDQNDSCFVLSRSSSALVPSCESCSPVATSSPSKWSWWGQFWSASTGNSSSSNYYLAKITRARQSEPLFVSQEDSLAFALQHGDGFELISTNKDNTLQLRFHLIDAARGPISTCRKILNNNKMVSPTFSPSAKPSNEVKQHQQHLAPFAPSLLKESLTQIQSDKKKEPFNADEESEPQEQSKKKRSVSFARTEEKENNEHGQEAEGDVVVIETNCNTARSQANFVVPHSERALFTSRKHSANDDDENQEEKMFTSARLATRQAFSTSNQCDELGKENSVSVSDGRCLQHVPSSATSSVAPGTEPSPTRPIHEGENMAEEQQEDIISFAQVAKKQNPTHEEEEEDDENIVSFRKSLSAVIVDDEENQNNGVLAFSFENEQHHHDSQNLLNEQSAFRAGSAPVDPSTHRMLEKSKSVSSSSLHKHRHQRSNSAVVAASSSSSASSLAASTTTSSRTSVVPQQMMTNTNNMNINNTNKYHKNTSFSSISSTATSINPSAANSKQNSEERNETDQNDLVKNNGSRNQEPEPKNPKDCCESHETNIIEKSRLNNDDQENKLGLLRQPSVPLSERCSQETTNTGNVFTTTATRQMSKPKSASNSINRTTRSSLNTSFNSASSFINNSSMSNRSSVSVAVSEDGVGQVDQNFLFDGYQSKNNNSNNNNSNMKKKRLSRSPRGSNSSSDLRKLRGLSASTVASSNPTTPRSARKKRFATPLDAIRGISGVTSTTATPPPSSPASFFQKFRARIDSLMNNNPSSSASAVPPKKAPKIFSTPSAKASASLLSPQQTKKNTSGTGANKKLLPQTPRSAAEHRFVQNGKASLKNIVEKRRENSTNSCSSAHLSQARKHDLMTFVGTTKQK